jgi:hypothetical protein
MLTTTSASTPRARTLRPASSSSGHTSLSARVSRLVSCSPQAHQACALYSGSSGLAIRCRSRNLLLIFASFFFVVTSDEWVSPPFIRALRLPAYPASRPSGTNKSRTAPSPPPSSPRTRSRSSPMSRRDVVDRERFKLRNANHKHLQLLRVSLPREQPAMIMAAREWRR